MKQKNSGKQSGKASKASKPKSKANVIVDNPAAEQVASANEIPATTPDNAPATTPDQEQKPMANVTLTLSTKPRKSNRIVIFESPLHSVQFLRTAFGENLPQTLTLTGDGFAEPKAAKEPKVKETPEERKARLAALPKLTLAEKVARAEKRTEALRAKLAKAAEKNAAAPAI